MYDLSAGFAFDICQYWSKLQFYAQIFCFMEDKFSVSPVFNLILWSRDPWQGSKTDCNYRIRVWFYILVFQTIEMSKNQMRQRKLLILLLSLCSNLVLMRFFDLLLTVKRKSILFIILEVYWICSNLFQLRCNQVWKIT